MLWEFADNLSFQIIGHLIMIGHWVLDGVVSAITCDLGMQLAVAIEWSFELSSLGREYVLVWEENQSKYLSTKRMIVCSPICFLFSFWAPRWPTFPSLF